MATIERPITELVPDAGVALETPYYLIDEARLLRNLEVIAAVRRRSGAKSVLALKCFSTWAVFDLMRPYMDGTTSSSLYEARLGHEKFGKEVHAYSVAYSDQDVAAVSRYASKVIFNSVSQLTRYAPSLYGKPLGLRINPGVSHSSFELADPARRYSRLGATDPLEIRRAAELISGVMFHCNCENGDLAALRTILDHIGTALRGRAGTNGVGESGRGNRVHGARLSGGRILCCARGVLPAIRCSDLSRAGGRRRVARRALGNDGARHRPQRGGRRDRRCRRRAAHARPPGLPHGSEDRSPAIRRAPIHDRRPHVPRRRRVRHYDLAEPLRIGSRVAFADAAAYTLVKKNWFNGLPMPSIAVRRLDGRIDVVRSFGYEDYLNSLS